MTDKCTQNSCCNEADLELPSQESIEHRPTQSLIDATSIIGFPVIFSLLIIVLLFIVQLNQAIDSVVFTFEALIRISPFILLSVMIAAYLKASGSDQIVANAFQGNPLKSIIVASVFGAISPFCSCGVVPLVAGLLVAGVPIAPVLAFCIASPIMDPEMFILTAAELGLDFALIKTAAAIFMGAMTGYVTLLISRSGFLDDSLKDIAKPSCSTSCSSESYYEVVYGFWGNYERRQIFIKETLLVAIFLTRWLAFAFLLESLMIAYIPSEFIISWLGAGNAYALPLAVLLGVPAYLNGYAAIPLVGGLIEMGMSPATALAFMLAGSVTSIPAGIAIWSLAKPRLFSLYLVFAASGSMIAGYLFLFWLNI